MTSGTLEHARRLIQSSQWAPATEVLKRVLARDPECADAHLLLAIALLEQRRIHAARHEAELGAALEPESVLARRVLGLVSIGMARWAEAERHLREALELEPTEVATHVALAQLALARDRRAEAAEWLERALVLDPTDPDVLASLALIAVDADDVVRAERFAREALEESPGASRALIAMGHVLLRRGDVVGAREHAMWALQNDATDRDALALLTQCKMRESWLLGLWWRWATLTVALGVVRAIALVLVTFVAVQLARLVLRDLDLESAATAVQLVWLVVCAYTWIAPSIYRRSLEKELAAVRLHDDF